MLRTYYVLYYDERKNIGRRFVLKTAEVGLGANTFFLLALSFLFPLYSFYYLSTSSYQFPRLLGLKMDEGKSISLKILMASIFFLSSEFRIPRGKWEVEFSPYLFFLSIFFLSPLSFSSFCQGKIQFHTRFHGVTAFQMRGPHSCIWKAVTSFFFFKFKQFILLH